MFKNRSKTSKHETQKTVEIHLIVDPKNQTVSLRQRCGFPSLRKFTIFVIPSTIDTEVWGLKQSRA